MYYNASVASSFKYVLVGGVVFGIMAGTIAALTLSGGSGKKPAETVANSGTIAAPPIGGGSDKDSPADKKREEPPTAAADPAQVEKAERANDAGKDKLFAGDFRGASELFREAVARLPDPKYFINLGSSLFQEGKFDESLVALKAILVVNPTARQRDAGLKIAQAVLAECEKQNVTCHPPIELKAAIDQLNGAKPN